ncbi:MAG: hypothetical protein ACJAYS_001003 [Lentimonas sp.]|jgi:hypothetical protein
MSSPEECPYLPAPDVQMTYRCLTESKKTSEAAFYFDALKYGHYLWLNGHAGRSILALTRALYADLLEEASILDQWPLPYAALQWIVANHDSDEFPGNPRISFQHQASRLCGERQILRRARAWAVWALVREAKPTLQKDPTQSIEEPRLSWIEEQLEAVGHTNEVALWRTALDVLCPDA